MHELSVVRALLAQVERALVPHAGATVSRVHVRIGELAGVDPELFRSAYDAFRSVGPFAAADLALTFEPAAWVCPECTFEFPRGAPLTCSRCNTPARLARGADIVLDRIEAEVL